MDVHSLDDLLARPGDERYSEFLRVDSMSAGVYRLAAGEADPQSPHAEDEMYVVLAGRGRLRGGDDEAPVEPGSVAFVPAGEVHRFVDITEDLAVLVLFAPPESGG